MGRSILTLIAVLSLVMILSAPSPAAAARREFKKTVFITYQYAGTTERGPGTGGAGSGGLGGGSGGGSKNVVVCPDPTTCTDYTWDRTKWNSTPIRYELNAGSITNASAAITASFAAWTAPTGGTLSVVGTAGTTSCATAATTANGTNQICWRDISAEYPGAIAVTAIWTSSGGKVISEADTVFNSGAGFTWSYTNPGTCTTYGTCNTSGGVAGTYDIRNIGTHEFGHFLAYIADLYISRDTEMTMYGYGTTAELKKDSLAKGDCLAITAAYGGTCP